MHARLQHAEFQATPPHDLPFQRYHISHIQLIDDINGLYRRAHPANQLVIEGGVFSLKQGRRTKECEPLCPRGADVIDLVFGFERLRLLAMDRPIRVYDA